MEFSGSNRFLKCFCFRCVLNSATREQQTMSEALWDGCCGEVLGKDKWEWGMGRRGLRSANGSCAFPRSGRPRLPLAAVPLHCNYPQWRDSHWEKGQQKSRQRGIKSITDRMEDRLSSHSQPQEDFLQNAYVTWFIQCGFTTYVYENWKIVTCYRKSGKCYSSVKEPPPPICL